MKKLLSCKDAFEANLIKGRLENEGIPAVLLNEYINPLQALPAIDSFDVWIMVPDEEYDAALKIINEDESDDLAEG